MVSCSVGGAWVGFAMAERNVESIVVDHSLTNGVNGVLYGK